MPSKITPEFTRNRKFNQRSATVQSKSYELMLHCQADIVVFIKPFGEDVFAAFRSRPDFMPMINISNYQCKSPDSFVSVDEVKKAAGKKRSHDSSVVFDLQKFNTSTGCSNINNNSTQELIKHITIGHSLEDTDEDVVEYRPKRCSNSGTRKPSLNTSAEDTLFVGSTPPITALYEPPVPEPKSSETEPQISSLSEYSNGLSSRDNSFFPGFDDLCSSDFNFSDMVYASVSPNNPIICGNETTIQNNSITSSTLESLTQAAQSPSKPQISVTVNSPRKLRNRTCLPVSPLKSTPPKKRRTQPGSSRLVRRGVV